MVPSESLEKRQSPDEPEAEGDIGATPDFGSSSPAELHVGAPDQSRPGAPSRSESEPPATANETPSPGPRASPRSSTRTHAQAQAQAQAKAHAPRWQVALFFLLSAIALLGSSSYIAEIRNPNENVRVFMTMAMVEDHTIRIDHVVERHGWTNDMAKAPGPDGKPHLYSVKAPATSYLGVPVYWALTKIAPHLGQPVPTTASPPAEKEAWLRTSVFTLRVFAIGVPDLLFLIFFTRWLSRWSADPALRIAAAAGACLGTNYLAYSQMFASHAISGAAAFTAFALTVDERAWPSVARRPMRAFSVGILAGLPLLFEYHGGPLTLALGLFALLTFLRPKLLLPFALGAGLDALSLGWFHRSAFGSALTPPHKFLENQAYVQFHNTGIFGVKAPDPHAAFELSFSPTFGLFATSPFLLLGFLAIPFGLLFVRARDGNRVERRELRVVSATWLLMMALHFATVAGVSLWHGGWSIGPRYLGEAPPFFAFGAVVAIEQVCQRWPKGRPLLRGLAIGSALAGILAVGLTGLELNTLPEEIARPFTQFTLPMLRTGFAPWNVGNLVGAPGYRAFWCVAAALVVAGLIPLVASRGARVRAQVVTLVFAVVALGAGLAPSLSKPSPEDLAKGNGSTRWLAQIWQPQGVDRLTKAEETAKSFGPRRPCAWRLVASLDRAIFRDLEAAQAEAKAGDTKCTIIW